MQGKDEETKEGKKGEKKGNYIRLACAQIGKAYRDVNINPCYIFYPFDLL